jgi:hypothetical protein
MKSKDHSLSCSEQPPLYQMPGSSRAETALFGMLGVVSLATLGIALTWGSGPADSHSSSLAGYFRSGQAAADLRTAGAAVDYLMQPELPDLTNFIEPSPTQKNLVMPTNATVVKPRA